MNAVKIPRGQRVLLLAGAARVTRPRLLRALYLTRWAGQLPGGGVLTPAGLAGGCCGHYSFWRWRILLHSHRGDRPLPEDMKAALRGQAPLPARFAGDPEAFPAAEPDLAADEPEHPEGMIGNPEPIRSAHGQWTLVGYDEKGFACLDEQCPACSAQALIINEEATAECLTCSWQERRPAGG